MRYEEKEWYYLIGVVVGAVVFPWIAKHLHWLVGVLVVSLVPLAMHVWSNIKSTRRP